MAFSSTAGCNTKLRPEPTSIFQTEVTASGALMSTSSAGLVSAGSRDEHASNNRAAPTPEPCRAQRLGEKPPISASRRRGRRKRIELQLDIGAQRMVGRCLVQCFLVRSTRLVHLVQGEEHVAAAVGELDRMRSGDVVGEDLQCLVIGL